MNPGKTVNNNCIIYHEGIILAKAGLIRNKQRWYYVIYIFVLFHSRE